MSKEPINMESKLIWHNIIKEPLPETTTDIDLLVRMDNTPMLYTAVVWDGKMLHCFSGHDFAPWKPFPEWVKITDWAYINK